jgi:hypothetical protein
MSSIRRVELHETQNHFSLRVRGASAHCSRLEFRLQAARGIHHLLPRKRGTPNETPAFFGRDARMCSSSRNKDLFNDI